MGTQDAPLRPEGPLTKHVAAWLRIQNLLLAEVTHNSNGALDVLQYEGSGPAELQSLRPIPLADLGRDSCGDIGLNILPRSQLLARHNFRIARDSGAIPSLAARMFTLAGVRGGGLDSCRAPETT